MLTYTIRRLIMAVPTLLFIALVIFLLLLFAPGDPLANMPLSIPPEVRQAMREALGLGEAWHIRFGLFLYQFFIVEPCHGLGLDISNFAVPEGTADPGAWLAERKPWFVGAGYEGTECGQRIISFQSRSPVFDVIAERLPQTLWVVGMSYVVGVIIAIPIGIVSAYKQYSIFDQIGTLISMIGFSVPTFFTGVLLIVVFSTLVPTDSMFWLPSIYDTQHVVEDWESFVFQVRQMAMPVFVLALFNAAQISRYMRASMLDNLGQDYVRTARAKGMTEKIVVLKHVLRNSMIPVVTVIALGVPQVFGGAIITEQVFKVNGLGQLLITAIQGSDIPMVMTLTFLFAILIVLFNLIADVLYGMLDPRIRYD